MEKTVKLTLNGVQTIQDDSDPDTVETVHAAKYYKKNDSHYLIYEEMLGDHNLSKNRIKVKGSAVEVLKRGPVDVWLVFEENREWQTNYRTPYGEIGITICTRQVEVHEEADKMTVKVAYTLKAMGEPLSDHQLEIRAESEQ